MNSTFFTDFVMITSFMPIVFIGLLLGLFFVIRQMEKKKINFSKRMIVATLLGLLLGVVIQAVAKFPDDIGAVTWITETTKWYGLVGYGFMDLLKMLVVPLIFLSIIRVIINMKADQNLGKLTSRTILVLLSTTAISAIIAIIVGNLFKLGVGETVVQSQSEMKEISSIVDTLRGLLPSNPVKAMADANVVGVVIFAGFIGIAIKRLTKKYLEIVKPAIDLVEAGYKIITSVAMTVIKFMPYAVIALLANTIAGRGMSAIISVTKFIAAIYVSIGLVFVFHMIIISLNKLNPFKYIKNVAQPLILAFTSRSSAGALPLNVQTQTQRLGVPEGIANFSASFGLSIGQNGCAGIYPAMLAIMVAPVAHVDIDIPFILTLIAVVVISSFGVAGVGGGATFASILVLSTLNLPVALAGVLISIEPIIDMGRTALNVNDSILAGTGTAHLTGNLDKEKFNSNHYGELSTES